MEWVGTIDCNAVMLGGGGGGGGGGARKRSGAPAADMHVTFFA